MFFYLVTSVQISPSFLLQLTANTASNTENDSWPWPDHSYEDRCACVTFFFFFLKWRSKNVKLQQLYTTKLKYTVSLPGLDNISSTACYLCSFLTRMDGKLNQKPLLIVAAELKRSHTGIVRTKKPGEGSISSKMSATADPETSISWGVCVSIWRGCGLLLQGIAHCFIKHGLIRRGTL